VIWILWLNVNG
ncbi:hypothetical protein VC116063_003346B, partial [Vibrio cholerae O1 str. 116063]